MTAYRQEIRQRRDDEKSSLPWIGIITFSEESEKGHNLIADFIENVWAKIEDSEEIILSHAFGEQEAKLIVNAASEDIVTQVIAEAAEVLERGFGRSNEPLRKID